jgi:hypothetical protein
MQENASLREEVRSKGRNKPPPDNLEQGADKFTVAGYYLLRDSEKPYVHKQTDWSFELSWNRLLKFIGPLLSNEASEDELKGRLSNLCIYGEEIKYEEVKDRIVSRGFYDNKFDDVICPSSDDLRHLSVFGSEALAHLV